MDTEATQQTHKSVQGADQAFSDFDIKPEIVSALAKAGITHPFPIQAMTLPVALAGHDIIGQAKTGTGKTLGFGVPLLHNSVSPGEPGFEELATPGAPQAIVVAPTRELAVQVAGDLVNASKGRTVRIVQLYGGRAYEPQVNSLKAGVEVVVGTPGRILDLIKQRHLNLSQIRTVVLDEADEMLDLGFLQDVESILAATPPTRQTMLFSATMPAAVVAMARRYMSRPTHIRATSLEDDGQTVKNIRQLAYRAHSMDKIEMIARILQAEDRGLTIVFSQTKRTADRVAEDLQERGFAAGALHGDLGQGAREQALRAFRNGKIDVLVATDVAARGIDVEDVTHVINYQCPDDDATYLHRTGRTGRAGALGTAVTFVDWDDLARWALIDRALEIGIPDPPETYSSSPHLQEDLNIPAGTKGRLPRSERTRAGLGAEQIEDLGETGKRQASRSGSGRSGSDRSGSDRSGSGRGGSGRGGSGSSGSRRGNSSRGGSGRSGSDRDAKASSEDRNRNDRNRSNEGGQDAGSNTGSETSPRTDRPQRKRVRKYRED